MMKGKTSFTKAEAIAIEILLQQYAKAPIHKQLALREQMQVLGVDPANFNKKNTLTLSQFRKQALIVPVPSKIQKPVSSISISTILKEYFKEHTDSTEEKDITLDYAADILLQLGKNGFEGFISVDKLPQHISSIPDDQGIYMLLELRSQEPLFHKAETVGLTLELVRHKWVPQAKVLYIGSSYTPRKMNSLRGELTKIIAGESPKVGDKRGAYIKLMPNVNELLLCWKVCTSYSSKDLQRKLLHDFKTYYMQYPFANDEA